MEWKIFHKDENNSDYHYSTAMADPLFEVNSGKESLKKRIGPVDLKEQNKTSVAPAKETSASRTGNLKGQVDLTAYVTAQDIAHDRSKEFHWKFNPPVAARMIQLQNPLLRFHKTTKGNFSVDDF